MEMEPKQEHILVCLSASPSNPRLIETAAKMAEAFRAPLSALFVQTSDFSEEDEEAKARLQENIRLARSWNAQIETVYGDDIAYQIAEFARVSQVTKIVIGRSDHRIGSFLTKATLVERLISYAPELDIHIIPKQHGAMQPPIDKAAHKLIVFSVSDIIKSVAILVGATCLGYAFYWWGFTESNIITVYILGVLFISVITEHQIYSLVCSIVSVLVFNFLFTEPRFSLQAYDSGYPVTFLIMFIAAFLTGTLAVKLKDLAKQSARTAYRAQILFDTSQLLQKTESYEEIAAVSAWQLVKLLSRNVVVYLMKDEGLSKPYVFTASYKEDIESLRTEKEQQVALWAARNNRQTGATTEHFTDARCLYLAIRVNQRVYGVVGIELPTGALETFEHNIVLSILSECALAMESRRNAEEKEKAAVLARNEQLRADLLRSISHDLRTPLTSISGNASNLLSNSDAFDKATRQQLYSDIYDDSIWLINLVENLLSVTRIEDGRMKLNTSTELVDEVIAEALRHTVNRQKTHTIHVQPTKEFLLAKMDARLIVQVLINLIDNAVKYTPAGSHIEITVKKQNNMVCVQVADDGNGVKDVDKAHIFEMFYSANHKIADSRRSLGLGLALCRSVVQAHGGEIWVADNIPHGAVFAFTLPLEEVHVHE